MIKTNKAFKELINKPLNEIMEELDDYTISELLSWFNMNHMEFELYEYNCFKYLLLYVIERNLKELKK